MITHPQTPEAWIEMARLFFEQSAKLRHPQSDKRYPFTYYTGTLSLQGMARLLHAHPEDPLRGEVLGALEPFIAGQRREFWASFECYFCGGNGTAYLLRHGYLPHAAETVADACRHLATIAPRSKEGILSLPWCAPDFEIVWVDALYAVCPFLVNAGLALGESAWVDDAIDQWVKAYDLLRDPENGLWHQSRGRVRPGFISEDHWSRGNGWGALAAAELVDALPEDHPRYSEIAEEFTTFMAACMRYQGEDGLWRQEMTLPDSYVETSGSALILYALGVALETGLNLPGAQEAWQKGLHGLFRYATEEGDIFHTCPGCFSPGEGRIDDYLKIGPVLNDHHAFGPYILVCAQALKLASQSTKPAL
jgi:unsaturated rhamnogalacturonyl hydrolase